MDDVDLQIITHLARDGRISVKRLSQLLDIGLSTCHRRLGNLLDTKVSIQTFVNPTKLGFSDSAFIWLKVEPSNIVSVIKHLSAEKRITYVASLTGFYDVGVIAHCRSSQDLSDLIYKSLGQLDGIRDLQTCMYLDTILGSFATLSPEVIQGQKDWQTNIDEIDLDIITCLMKDGRISIKKLAREISISEPITRKRFQKLLKNRIISIKGAVNHSDIGFPVSANICLKVNLLLVDKVASKIASYQRMLYVTKCIGSFNIISNGLFRSTDDLSRFLENKICYIDGVKEIQTYIVMMNKHGKHPIFVPRISSKLK